MSRPTCDEVILHLQATGTGRDRVETIQEWCRANKQADSEELLQHLIDSNCQRGTVEKVGRFIHGDGWGLEVPGKSSDEIVSLRKQLAEVQRERVRQDAEGGARERQLASLRTRIERLEQDNLALEIENKRLRGVNREDLSDAPAQRPAKPRRGSRRQAQDDDGPGVAPEMAEAAA